MINFSCCYGVFTGINSVHDRYFNWTDIIRNAQFTMLHSI